MRSSSRIPVPNRHYTSGTFVRVLRHMRFADEPTIKTALSSPQAEEWRLAIQAELDQLIKLQCFVYEDVIPLPEGLVPCKSRPIYVLKLKRRADGLSTSSRLVWFVYWNYGNCAYGFVYSSCSWLGDL